MDHYVRGEEALGRVLVIGYLERLFPAGIADMEREFLIETILRWAVDPLIPKNNLIIFTTTNYDGLHPDLKSRLNKIQTLAIPRPDNRQRAKFITAWFYSLQGNTSGQGRPVMPPGRLRFGEEFGENDRSRILTLAQKTAGLNNMGVEDMILRALARHGGRLTSNAVSRHKKTLLAGESAGLVDVIEPRFGFEVVGGLLGVRNRLMQVCRALNHADPIVRRTIPMGILFLGPPGTGKSLVAEALARESKLTFVKLGNFRDMYVGQSERNLSLALQLIRSLAPVVVFVDEIDQNIGRRGNSGESGPEKRLFARLLEFMSDSEMRGQVLWIGASNEPKNLDDAFKRAGRFDLKLPFFLPELPERRSILDIKINGGRGAIPNHIGDEELARIAAQTDGFSGAELEVLVNEGLRLAVGDERPQGVVLETRHLDEVLRRYDPSDSIRKYREMELEIAKDIPDADLLPERVRVEMKRRSQ